MIFALHTFLLTHASELHNAHIITISKFLNLTKSSTIDLIKVKKLMLTQSYFPTRNRKA